MSDPGDEMWGKTDYPPIPILDRLDRNINRALIAVIVVGAAFIGVIAIIVIRA